jgi:colanic acid biosynthesis glycosyl transferase WcaI
MFFAQCYAPEDVSAAVLITELATDLANKGHQITVVTIAPNYPYGRVYSNYRNQLYQVSWLDGVRVVRTWSYISPLKTFWPRIFNYATYSTTSFYGGLFAGKPDILVSFSPPLPLGLSAWLLSRLWGVPWVLQLEDVYPDAAVAAGVLKNRPVIALFSTLERFLYKHATHISLISESFRRNLMEKGVNYQKMTLIPVWADPDLVAPLQKENFFRDQYGLNGKFVVMYAGTLGHTSALEEVLGAAEILRNKSDVRFVIIGEGVKKAELEKLARNKGLRNIIFLPFMPRDIFAEMLAAADVSLVTLNRDSSKTSLPSKAFNIMASARPILAVAPKESELSQLIEETGCGVSLETDHPERLAEMILKLKKKNKGLIEMGQKGRIQIETRFARTRCVELYENMLLGICKKITEL